MKQLLPYMKKYKHYAFLTPLLMILEVATDIFLPYLMARIVDVGIANRDLEYVMKLGLLMIALALLGTCFGILSAIFAAKAGHGFASELRMETFRKIQEFSFKNLDDFSRSSLITRVTHDITTIGQVTVLSLRIGFRSPFMMIFALIMANTISTQLTLVFMITVPLSFIIMYLVLKKARPLFSKLQKQTDKLNGRIKENLTMISVVKTFNREGFEEDKFEKNNQDLRETALKAITTLVFLNPLLNAMIYGTIIAVLWFGSIQVVSGTLGHGALISFITYITQVLLSLIVLASFFIQLLRGVASQDRLLEVWSTHSELYESDHPIHTVKDGTITFDNVSFKYTDNSDDVLSNINLHIHSKETIGIIGSTGSSKSSLVHLIPRLYDTSQGSVRVGGIDVKDYAFFALRNSIAYTHQNNVLFSGTIKSNLLWGNQNASDAEIINALKASCAWEFLEDALDPLQVIVEEHGDNFSGGQKQRLCIARSLIKNPKILILDDSTSAVDTLTDKKIQETLKNSENALTTLIIGQRISSLQHADRIIVMHQGCIQEVGSHEYLLKHSSIYKEIYHSQQGASYEEY